MSGGVIKTGDWARASRTVNRLAGRELDTAINRAVLAEANFYRTKIVVGIRTQAPGGKRFKPLAASTLESRRDRGKRSSKALIENGDLRNSVTVKQAGNGTAFIGVLRTSRNKEGKSLANIGAVHENGATVTQRVTPRQVAFLNARNFRQGRGRTRLKPGDTLVIRIPARPFIRPVVEKYGGERGRRRFMRRLVREARGILGSTTGVGGV